MARSHGNVSGIRTYQPKNGTGDTVTEKGKFGLSNIKLRSHRPATENIIQEQDAVFTPEPTTGQHTASSPEDRVVMRKRDMVRNIKNRIKEIDIEVPIRRLSNRKLFGK